MLLLVFNNIIKVYLPCILQTKKRYVGYMYETRNQVIKIVYYDVNL